MGVTVTNRHDVRSRLVHAAVNETLGIDRAIGAVEPVAVEVELDDVVFGDQAGTARARQEIAFGVFRVADADMAECINHAFVAENAVGHHQISDCCQGSLAHGA